VLSFAASAQTVVPVLDEIKSIGSGALPVERSFDVATAGDLEISVVDLATPAALDGIKLAVTRNRTIVTTLDGAGTKRFPGTVGNYVVRVVALPKASPGSGSFTVGVKDVASSANVLAPFTAAASLPPPLIPDTRKVLDTQFDVAASGSYRVTLTDLALPQALTGATLAITRVGGASLDARLDAPGSATFNATPGTYRLFAIGDASPTAIGGLFGIRVVNQSSGQSIYVQAVPVGRTQSLGAVALGAGGHSLIVRDLAFPAVLAQLTALVASDGLAVARASAAGTTPFTAVAGTHEAFAYALAAANPGTGGFQVELRPDGAAAKLSELRTAATSTDPVPTFAFPLDVATAGAYRVRFADFEFPAVLSNFAAAIWQNGSALATLAAPGTLNPTLAAGRAYLLVSARPSSATTSGLIGVDVTPAAGGTAIFETTQGVGAVFRSSKLSILDTARYDTTVTDLGFPANFADLAGVVTRGADRIGSIFGGGTFGFDTTPGNYFVNLIAKPNGAATAGTYGLLVTKSPPAPVVTLTASSPSVTQGSTVDLTWSAQNSTGCTASGGWSGTKATSGTEKSAAISVPSTFTLTCVGAGGSKAVSVSVDATVPKSSGGGGALPPLTLLALLAAWSAQRRPYHRRRAALEA
jgi:PKD repeat protein